MSWSGMFKKHSKSKVANTYPTTNDGERKLVDQNEAVHAENKRLVSDVEQLRSRLGEEYDRGYEDALKTVFNVIEERDGRSGKKQILSDVQNLLAAHREKH